MAGLFDYKGPPPAAAPIARRRPAVGESGFSRVEGDHYQTEPFATRAVLRMFSVRGPVLEPCAGAGAILEVLQAQRIAFEAFDLVDRGHPAVRSGVNFLEPAGGGPSWWPGCVLTNPPYDQAEPFVRRALELTRPGNPAAPPDFRGGQVVMLLRHEFDCAQGRTDLWELLPFCLKVVLTKRLQLFEGPNGGRRHHAWYCWDWRKGRAQHTTRWQK